MTAIVIDLCSGTGSATEAFRRRGFRVVRVELDPTHDAEIHADVRTWSWDGPRPLLVWASPPCTEFSRSFLPWINDPRPPDMSVVRACLRVVRETEPLFWVLENVAGAARWFRDEPGLGPCAQRIGPVFLWGRFPRLDLYGGFRNRRSRKERLSGRRRADRARIPAEVSEAMAVAVLGGPLFARAIEQSG